MAGDGAGKASRLVKIDASANTSNILGTGIYDPNVGDSNGEDWTCVAITPTRDLYLLRRFAGIVHVYSVPADGIHLNSNPLDTIGDGAIDNLTDHGSTGLVGNVDGVCAGPDGNIYFSSFNTVGGPQRNGLYRFRVSTGITEFVGTFANQTFTGIDLDAGTNLFFTDLAFDPLTGNLVGSGADPNGKYTLYQLPSWQVLIGVNQTFQWDWFNGAASPWNGADLRAATHPVPDGITFNNLTGQLYLASDGEGVSEYGRATAQFIRFIVTNAGQNSGFGYDLASLIVAPPPVHGDMACTYTQGGWGSKPHGNNPGALLQSSFASVYPGGSVQIGGKYTLTFTSAAAISSFLPQGGTPAALTASAVNSKGKINVLAGQVLALRLNVDFSGTGAIKDAKGNPVEPLGLMRLANFSTQDTLGGMALTTAQADTLNHLTAADVLADANTALGGGKLPTYVSSVSQLNDLVTLLNEAFDNCIATSWAQTHLAEPLP